MNVFLGSQGLGALTVWFAELPRPPRHAVLVPTAGNPLAAPPWVEVAEAALTGHGLRVDALISKRLRRVVCPRRCRRPTWCS